MNRICFLMFLAGIIFLHLSVFAQAGESAKKQPNIVVFLADDAGYSDFSCYGSKNINTPHVDQLAKEGIRFTDFYAAAPNCSPSRAGLLTGRIPSRIGVYNYIDPYSPMHLPRSEITLASLLKQNGYSTCITGKWHLNGDIASKTQPQPNEHGFDYWFCTDRNASPSHKNPVNIYRNGKAVGEIEGYSCQIIVDEAIGWLQNRNEGEPFFLYIPFHEPHVPIASPPELIKKHTGTEKERKYYANIENMDNAIGRILTYLHEQKLKHNTLVVFLSDNGGTNHASNYPLRGRKSNVWDGGIRVAGIMRWPGHIKPESISKVPVSAVDILPTICQATGISLPGKHVIDGTSILPLFMDQEIQREIPLYWYFYRVTPSIAMREGDLMLIGYLDTPNYKFTHPVRSVDIPFIKESKIVRFELFNLSKDIGQTKDLSEQEPERLKQMSEKMKSIHQETLANSPVWIFHEGK